MTEHVPLTPAAFRERRKKLWRHQKAAAAAFGVSPRTIWTYEAGKAAITVMVELALVAREAGLRTSTEEADHQKWRASRRARAPIS